MVGKKESSTQKINLVVQFILGACVDGTPPRGIFKDAQRKFSLSRRTVNRYWTAAKKQQDEGKAVQLVSGKKFRNNSKRVTLDLNLLSSLHYTKRGTIRRLAVGLGCSKSTVGRWVIQGLIRAHTSAIKPNLTAPNKLLRLRFTLESIELDRMLNVMRFRNMHNTIHIDEKWFYMTRSSQRFYLAPGEEEPHRMCKSKNYIEKIMFMCAVSRPLFAENGEVLFDGKIGIFPFTVKVPAKRKSKNRPAGTMETKAIQSINREVMKACLITKIIPAIVSKWPTFAPKVIYIQQDNAKPHILDSDPDFRLAAQQSGFDIRLVQQPPNSPDTNVNDLGFFRAIQSLQVQTACKNVDELVNAVEKSFAELSPTTLDNVFISLQCCMLEIMKANGRNDYKLPHMRKDALRRSHELQQNLQVPLELAMQCIKYLQDMGCSEAIATIVQALGLEPIDVM